MTILDIANAIHNAWKRMPDSQYLAVGLDPESLNYLPIIMGYGDLPTIWKQIQHDTRYNRSHGLDVPVWVLCTSKHRALVIPNNADVCAELFPYYTEQVFQRFSEGRSTQDEFTAELEHTARWIEVI